MTPTQTELYQRIHAFTFDPPNVQVTFAAKLAQENEWSADFTARALAEYKRYTFLAVASGHPVAPSAVVDQVWHLHMTYTQSYWGEFCPQVLNYALHHYPSRGGEAEQTKLQQWYAQTLTSYTHFFGEPPADIWPTPAEQAQPTANLVRINKADYWLIRKPSITSGPEAESAAALPITGAGTPELQLYEMAYLAGEKARVLATVVASLIERGVLQPVEATGHLTVSQVLPPEAHILERTVVSAVLQRGRATYGEISHAVYNNLPVQALEQRLRTLGLIHGHPTAQGCLFLILILATAVSVFWLLGAFFSGEAVEQPLSLLFVWGLLFWLVRRWSAPPPQREQLLQRLRTRLTTQQSTTGEYPATAQMATQVVALWGVAALAGNAFDPLRQLLTPQKEGGTSCGGACGGGGCGSGCGGGGCGGGCGGGGCGGG